MKTKKPSSALLRALQTCVLPWVEQHGIGNLIVAQASWQAMQGADELLPPETFLEQTSLRSKRVPVKGRLLYGGEAAQVDAHWPKDRLYSRRAPLLGFVVKGIVAIPFGDYKLHCKTGHSFLIPPGTPHSDGSHLLLDDDFLHEGSREILYMMVRGNGVECWLSCVQHYQRIPPASQGDNYYIPHPLARQYLETFTDEMLHRRIHYKTIGGALILTLVTLLLREIQEMRVFQSDLHQLTTMDSASDFSFEEQNPIARAEEYIQNNLQGELSIDKVANHLYLSRAYFTRLFRAHTGKTFVEYVTQCRVEEAKVLLHSTEWPVNRVGEVVGLKPSRFRAIFQARVGISPTEFRRKMREEHRLSENISNIGTE